MEQGLVLIMVNASRYLGSLKMHIRIEYREAESTSPESQSFCIAYLTRKLRVRMAKDFV